MGTGSDTSRGGRRVRGLVLKAIVLFGGVLLFRRLRRSTTRWDHAKAVALALSGEKFSREQACRDPDNYFNLRMLTCPATEMVDGSRVLYFEQAFWRTPQKPFRQVVNCTINSSLNIRGMTGYEFLAEVLYCQALPKGDKM